MVSLVLFTFEKKSQIISDRGKLLACFNSKEILLFTRLLFAIGSALTAAATSMNAFIVGKAITGIGSSGSYITIINIIIAFTSPLEQGRYFGYIGFVWGFGTMLVCCPFSILLSC
jgi:MFS family permease